VYELMIFVLKCHKTDQNKAWSIKYVIFTDLSLNS